MSTRRRARALVNAELQWPPSAIPLGWKTRGRRLLTTYQRALPDFLIVGAQKGGTTSLYGYLSQHEQVLTAVDKELHFFDETRNLRRSLLWYRSHFPKRAALRAARADGRAITGEATQRYLCHPHATERIARSLPGVKLLVLLRDPVERAYSQYQMQVREGSHNLSFEEALRVEEELAEGRVERLLHEEAVFSVLYSYKARGLYALQLERLYHHFPASHVLVLCSEDFFAYPQETMNRVCDFLHIDRRVWHNFQVWHPGVSRDAPAVGTRSDLVRFFRPKNERLYELVGCDFGWQR